MPTKRLMLARTGTASLSSPAHHHPGGPDEPHPRPSRHGSLSPAASAAVHAAGITRPRQPSLRQDPVINGGHDDVPRLPRLLDQDGALRCGLPAQFLCRFTMRSTDGPLESAGISCPAGHHFTGPSNPSPGTATTTTIRAPPDPVPAPGITASSAVMTALTVAADPPPGSPPPSRSVEPAARTVLPPTTRAAPPPCGSPPRARAAGPHRQTFTRPFSITTATSETCAR
jgi:hypothetical protein